MANKLIPYSQLMKASYNRPIERAHVNRIKSEFHPDQVSPTIVSFRDGKYWIIDHQHLSTAIFELNGCDPNTLIDCDVRTGMTYEEEADLYYRLNTGTKPLLFSDRIVGLIEAKDPDALRFRDLVEGCGYVVGRYTNRSLKAVSLAWKMFCTNGGEETLRNILSLTQMCWPGDGNGVDSRMIEGIKVFLEAHSDEYQIERFVKAMSACDPKELIRQATVFYRQMDSRSFTKPYCVYTQIVNVYNRGLRNKLTPAAPSAS